MGLQLPKFNMPKLPSLPGLGKSKAKLDAGLMGAPPVSGPAGAAMRAPSSRTKLPVGKILMILVPVAGLIFAGVMVTSLGQQVEGLKGEIVNHRLKAEELSVQNEQLTARLTAISKQREDTDSRLVLLKEQLSAASEELEDARTELETLQWRFDRVSENKVNLETEVARLTQENEDRQLRLEEISSEKQTLEENSQRLRERLAFVDRDYQSLVKKVETLEAQSIDRPYDIAARSANNRTAGSTYSRETPTAGLSAAPGPTVELPPIIVRKDQAGTASPVRGRLVEVNEPHRFVVVDKGSVDGVRVGMTFDVVRGGGQPVARATVVRVRPQLAACDFVGADGTGPQIGDVAVQRNR